jgi:hypothetical protein
VSNDNYSLSAVGARERERGRLEARIEAEKEIDSLMQRHADEMAALRMAIEPSVDAARTQGASDAVDKFRFEVKTVIARSNLATSQRRMLSDLIDALPVPPTPNVTKSMLDEITLLRQQISQLERNVDTQIRMKQDAMTGRSKALSDAAKAELRGKEEGRSMGLTEAAEYIRGLKIQKSPAKKPTKLAEDLAESISKLGGEDG